MEENITELVTTLTSLVQKLDDKSTKQGVGDARKLRDPDDAFDSEEKHLKDQQKQQAKLNAEESEKLDKKRKKNPRKILQTVMPIKVMEFDKRAIKQLQSIMVAPVQIEEEQEKKPKKSSWWPALLAGVVAVWDKLKDAWLAIRTTVGNWATAMSKWWKKFKKTMSLRWSRLRGWFKNFKVSDLIPESIKKWWSRFRKGVSKKWLGVKSWFNKFKVSNLIPESIKKWWKNMNKSMVKRWTGIKTWFKNFSPKKLIPQSIRGWWGKLNFSKKWTGIKTWFTDFSPKKLIPTGIRNWWKGFDMVKKWAGIKTWFTDFSPKKLIPTGIRNWWKGFDMGKKWLSFKAFFVDLPGKIKALIPTPIKTALTTSVNIMKTAFAPVRALFSGISGLFGGGKGAKSVSIFTKIANFFGPSNPVMKGIFTFLKTAGSVLGKLFLPITIIMEAFNFVTGFMEGFKKDGIIGGIREGVKSVFNSLVAFPLDLLKSGVSWIAGKLGFTEVEKTLDEFSFKELFTDLFDKLFGVIDMSIGFIKNLISDGAEKVKDLFRSEEEIKARKAAGARAKDKEAAMKETFQRSVSSDGMNKILAAKKTNDENEAEIIESQTAQWRDAMASAARQTKDENKFRELVIKQLESDKKGSSRAFLAMQQKAVGSDWEKNALKNFKKVRGQNVVDTDAMGDLAQTLANQRAQSRRLNDTVKVVTDDWKKTGSMKLGDMKIDLADIKNDKGKIDPKIVEYYESLIRMRDETTNNELKIQYSAMIKSLDNVGVKESVDHIKAQQAEAVKFKADLEDYDRAIKQGGPQRRLQTPEKLDLISTNYEMPQEERLKEWKLTSGPQPVKPTRSLEETKAYLNAISSVNVDQLKVNEQVKAAEAAAIKQTQQISPIVPQPSKQTSIDPNRLSDLELTLEQPIPELNTKQASDHIKQSGDKINQGAQSLHFETLEGWPRPQSPYAWDYVKMAGESITKGSKQLHEQAIQYEKSASNTNKSAQKNNQNIEKKMSEMVNIMTETVGIQKKTLSALEQHGLIDKQGNTMVNNGGNSTTVNNVTMDSDIMKFRDKVVGRLYNK